MEKPSGVYLYNGIWPRHKKGMKDEQLKMLCWVKVARHTHTNHMLDDLIYLLGPQWADPQKRREIRDCQRLEAGGRGGTRSDLMGLGFLFDETKTFCNN